MLAHTTLNTTNKTTQVYTGPSHIGDGTLNEHHCSLRLTLQLNHALPLTAAPKYAEKTNCHFLHLKEVAAVFM